MSNVRRLPVREAVPTMAVAVKVMVNPSKRRLSEAGRGGYGIPGYVRGSAAGRHDRRTGR